MYHSIPSHLKNTPWGAAHHHRSIAPGIDSLQTSSHGGIALSSERWDTLLSIFPNFKGYASPGWLEEDVDQIWAVLAFPELFPPIQVFDAFQWTSNPEALSPYMTSNLGDFYSSPHGARLKAIAKVFFNDHSQHYYLKRSPQSIPQPTQKSQPQWQCLFEHASSKQPLEITLSERPTYSRWYTLEELNLLSISHTLCRS